MRLGIFAIGCVLLGGAALAADVPLDDAAFTTFIQQKLQLYTPRPVVVVAPFTLTIAQSPTVSRSMNLRALHDQCVKAPKNCDDTVHDYVQETARVLSAPPPSPPPVAQLQPLVPSDKDDFTRDLARRASALMPQIQFGPDGTALDVTRPGGHRFKAEASGLYAYCQQMDFRCGAMLDAYVLRFRNELFLPDKSQLRAAPGYVASCSVIASVGNSISCRIRPSPAPLSGFFRRAFSNIGAYCFKLTPRGAMPLTNADRADMDLSVDEGVDTCLADTRSALGPLTLPPLGSDGVGRLDAHWAASYALYPDEWSSWAAEAGGKFLIAMPSRDTLLFVKGDGPQAQELLISRVDALLGRGVGVTPDVYRWTGDGFMLGTDRSRMNMARPTTVDVMPREH